jgi:hypothetical protein
MIGRGVVAHKNRGVQRTARPTKANVEMFI